MSQMVNCQHCRKDFNLTEEDLQFFKEVSPVIAGKTFLIPAPKLCGDCRMQPGRRRVSVLSRTRSATGLVLRGSRSR